MARSNREEMGRAIEKIEKALDQYALAYLEHYGDKVSKDFIIRRAWLDILQGTATLLEGETGYLDPGRTWERLTRMARAHGYSKEEVE